MFPHSLVHLASCLPTCPLCRCSDPALSRSSVTMAPLSNTLVRFYFAKPRDWLGSCSGVLLKSNSHVCFSSRMPTSVLIWWSIFLVFSLSCSKKLHNNNNNIWYSWIVEYLSGFVTFYWPCNCHVTLYFCTVSSGSITVNADSSVQLLAEEAVPLDQLDIAVSILHASFHSPTHQHWSSTKVLHH